MSNSTGRKSPHGMVPISNIKDPATKAAIMKLNENMKALQDKVFILEKKGVKYGNLL